MRVLAITVAVVAARWEDGFMQGACAMGVDAPLVETLEPPGLQLCAIASTTQL